MKIFGFVICIIIIFLLIQKLRCETAVRASSRRLESYDPKTASLHYGKMTYVDRGEGEVILSVHGIFGGFDQAFETCKDLADEYRIVAPSRFGYLGSDVCGDGTPHEQTEAYVELLNSLKIDKVYVLATSAGGSIAFRFALDYPERVKGIILYCSAMPLSEKIDDYAQYAGPPKALCNDYAMFLFSPLFIPIMGMEKSTVEKMFPIGKRKTGVIIDATIVNPDMSRNYVDYPVEKIENPILILHSKDDKMARYSDVEKVLHRFKNKTLCTFETGGHLMKGHEKEIREALKQFMN